MTIAVNPFALLEDESAEPVIVEQKQQAKKTVASQPKKAPLKESTAGQKAVVGSTPKPIQKNTGKAPVKEGQFEEQPEHNHVSAPSKPARAQKKGGREFDRRSNNPKSSGNDKKDTAGKASWGNEVEAQLENAEGAPVEEEELVAAEPEPEESYKSLAEYQAEKEAARVAANLAVRKANEGADQSQWKKLTPLVKDDKLDDLMFAGKAPKEKEQKRKEKPVKTVLEITQTFAPAPRPERSDRGGFRGGRGESNGKPRGASGSSRGGAPKGGRGGSAGARGGRGGRGGKGAGVNVMDQNAFPSLA